MTAVTEVTSLRERAIAAHRQQQEAYARDAEERAAREREQLVKFALEHVKRVFGVELSAYEIDGTAVLFEIDDMRMGYRLQRHRESYRQWDELYLILPCSAGEKCASLHLQGVGTLGSVAVEFGNLADLGDLLARGADAVGGRTCFACQQLREEMIDGAAAAERAAPAPTQTAAPDDEDSPARRDTVNACNLYVIARALESIDKHGIVTKPFEL